MKKKYYESSENKHTADLHTHSSASLDGDKPISYLIKRAKSNKTTVLAVSDHNTLNGVNRYLDKICVPREEVMDLVDSKLIFVPATEITCKVKEVPNLKGNPSKVHLLAYGLNRDENSYISNLLKIKHENDGKVDRGYLTQLQKYFNLDISDIDIIKYIREKQKVKVGFNTFGVQDTFDFVKKQKLKLTDNDDELLSIIRGFKATERLNLDAEDVINVVHASGGFVVMAHPYMNLKRTSRPRELVQYLINKGIDGFEMYYPGHTTDCDKLIKEEISKSGRRFLFTGGSDYHSDETQEFEYPNFIPFVPPEVDKVREFLDNLNELKIARERGDLSIKGYEKITGVNAKQIVKNYKGLNYMINEQCDKFLR